MKMVECPRCHGSGLEDNVDPKTGQRPACQRCGGLGQVPG